MSEQGTQNPDLLNWGILGTGNIARQFAAGMNSSRRGRIVAVGSRSHDAAWQFAGQFAIPAAHGSYEALLADRNVQAVYVSLPNSMHHEWTIRALRAGKHVLCEKPFAVNAAQAEEMFDVARRSGRVLVEAFMYLSHPQTQSILDTVARGDIGQVKIIRTSFCYRTTRIQGNIRFSPELAGGAMMDVGCYCLSFCRLVAGAEPDRVLSAGKLHASGVDEWAAGTLGFPNGVLATFVCGMTVQADNTASICGSDGYIEIGWPWKPQRLASYTIGHSIPPRQDARPGHSAASPPRQQFTVGAKAELYALEADDFAATVRDGAPPAVTAEHTLGNMRVLDQIRRQIGLPF